MEYDDVYISDDGTRAVKWVSVDEHATGVLADEPDTGVEDICAKCALHGSNCMLDDIDGWSTMVEAIRKDMRAQREWNPVCGEGMFVELDILEFELHNVGGG